MVQEEKIPKIICWMGQPIRDMTREELLEAFEELGQAYNDTLEQNIRRWQEPLFNKILASRRNP